ncbi:MAG: OmpA family protein, partial [Bacteroidetes bacterium]|nr:OmpA family protein [Bacteroidota bacterium]
RGVFGEDEAEVSLRGDEMIVRMYGLNFPVGSSEIRPANFSLLTKLQQVLREFPDAPITIEGHTDSRGNDATNQRLSDERATAVQEYLMANMSSLSPDQVEAVGYGESRPLASNETEEGRAQNRRIDVTISLP